MVKQFQVTKKRRELIDFQLGDDEYVYHFKPTKVASVMLPVLDHDDQDEDTEGSKLSMTQRTWDWLKAGLEDDQYGRIRGRLQDAEDDLDVEDVAQVVKWLMSQVSGRPTGSRRG